jgi:hypothetical protein
MNTPRTNTAAERVIRFTRHIWAQSRERFPYCAALGLPRLRRLLSRAALHAPRYAEHAVIGKLYLRFRLPDGQAMTLVVADSDDGGVPCRFIITALTDQQIPVYCVRIP